jgi:hypothetical protein
MATPALKLGARVIVPTQSKTGVVMRESVVTSIKGEVGQELISAISLMDGTSADGLQSVHDYLKLDQKSKTVGTYHFKD